MFFWLLIFFFSFLIKIDIKKVMVMYWQYIFQKVICNVMQYIFCNVTSNVMQYFLKVMFNSMHIPSAATDKLISSSSVLMYIHTYIVELGLKVSKIEHMFHH